MHALGDAGRLTRWLGVRSIGNTIAGLGKTEADSAESIVVPKFLVGEVGGFAGTQGRASFS